MHNSASALSQNKTIFKKGFQFKFFTLAQNFQISQKCILTEFEISTPSRFQDIQNYNFSLTSVLPFRQYCERFTLESWLTFVAKQLILQVLNLYFVVQ